MSTIERRCRDRLYYHMDGWARAIRLVGADTQVISVDRLEVAYTNEPLVLPPELRAARDSVVREQSAVADANGRIFFDGPNTRLITWRLSPRDDEGVGRELDVLHLTLGPVGWYDFEGLNGAFRANPETVGPEQMYEYYVGLSFLLSSGGVEKSKLSNILDNAVTLVTDDGYVGYQRRSGRVSLMGGAFTSAVAENTNRFLDDTSPEDPSLLYNADRFSADAPVGYRPRGVPHPVAAVLRGIEAEVSPVLRSRIGLENVFVTGLSFDLEGLHPSLLFMVIPGLSAGEVLAARRSQPGAEYIEGTLGFVPADLASEETRDLLRQPNWVPSGQASVIRAIEVINGVARDGRIRTVDAIDQLRRGKGFG